MRFHGIMMTRDDGDVMEECLNYALTWCDAIYIYDTGSSDSSWDIANALAAKDKRIVPWKHESIAMHNGLRAYLFHHFRDRMEEGDWVAIVDTDEFYHLPPPQFVHEYLGPRDSAVYERIHQFFITQSEAAKWDAGDRSPFDRTRAITELRRHYKTLEWTEPRMFRYRRSMQWSHTLPQPWNMGFVASARIPIRHYPHRDPIQLQRRHALRHFMLSVMDPSMAGSTRHWDQKDWRALIVRDDAPDLCFWAPGTELPPVLRRPVTKPLTRMAQWTLHRFLLPALDRRRPQFQDAYRPEAVPPEIDAKIVETLRQISAAGAARP
jgi:hypothetical protein